MIIAQRNTGPTQVALVIIADTETEFCGVGGDGNVATKKVDIIGLLSMDAVSAGSFYGTFGRGHQGNFAGLQ